MRSPDYEGKRGSESKSTTRSSFFSGACLQEKSVGEKRGTRKIQKEQSETDETE